MYLYTVDTDPSSRLSSKSSDFTYGCRFIGSPPSFVLFLAFICWCESCWYFSLPHLLLDTGRTKAGFFRFMEWWWTDFFRSPRSEVPLSCTLQTWQKRQPCQAAAGKSLQSGSIQMDIRQHSQVAKQTSFGCAIFRTGNHLSPGIQHGSHSHTTGKQ